MSNDSFVMAPKGVGVEVTLEATSDDAKQVTLILNIPAVGKHSLRSENRSGFNVAFKNTGGNAYEADLT